MNKKINKIFAGIASAICLLGILTPLATSADFTNLPKVPYANPAVVKTIKVVLTAYSSTVDQTDDSPFITASNKHVKDGIVANNLLPFGTRIRIPDIYGDKVFTVEDRMNKNQGKYHVDIWMPETSLAVNFGIKTTNIEILTN